MHVPGRAALQQMVVVLGPEQTLAGLCTVFDAGELAALTLTELQNVVCKVWQDVPARQSFLHHLRERLENKDDTRSS